LAAKVYTSKAKPNREVKVHETVGGHALIAPLVHFARLDGGNHAWLLIFPRYGNSLSDCIITFGVLYDDADFDIAKDLLEALAHMHSHNVTMWYTVK
jgi:serine/threonine protein kinase